MQNIIQRIYEAGILPVIAIDDAAKAVPLTKALAAGGLTAVEITFRTEAAAAAIRAISEAAPDILVGAGTVRSREQADAALAAGARFIVTPGFHAEVVRYCLSRDAFVIPGTATGGEMEQAMALGLHTVKFFPAEQNGGIGKLKALAGPYRDLQWIPTGGINAHNLRDYLSFDQIAACGGTWMVKKDLIDAEQWEEITALCNEAVREMLDFRLDFVEINCRDEAESARATHSLSALFGCHCKAGGGRVLAGGAVPEGGPPCWGSRGQITVSTLNADRAAYHLARRGILFSEHTWRRDEAGRTLSVCLEGETEGFTICLANRQTLYS